MGELSEEPGPQSTSVPGPRIQSQTGVTPNTVQGNLGQMESSYPGLDSGFIWQYENIVKAGNTAAQYATAIATGLGSGKSQGATT